MKEKLPLAVEIEINSNCNLSCVYCPNSKAERSEQGSMSIETFESIMTQLQEQDYAGRISYHFYNEPLLSPNLNLFVSLTKKYLPKSRTVLYTNGTGLTKEIIEELSANGLDRFVITEHHQAKLDNLKTLLEDSSFRNRFWLKFTNFRDLFLTNRGGSVRAGSRISEPINKPCFIPKCALVISLKGNVIACYEDYFQRHTMGNVLEQNIYDIWNSEKYIQFRKELAAGNRHKFDVCKACNNQLIIV